ncbi:hypothetical protein SAY86_015894 [Trapa natans]|uniref:B box-type domain-containing protein n=1 Tax=Trapa natans TaxID=22666 RepID=A0AAN7LKI1_TRANT|nr:hypothetical protein SAY86_015894 [Trapa natans]
MKVLCDVCSKDEAVVFCTADEAALCGGCDYRVHHANKLASKHQRFSLLSPSSKEFPLCDVCQEKRAFLFCHQDKAILCRDCDSPIHTANEHTRKHSRFLLTGVKLFAASALNTPAAKPPVSSAGSDKVPSFKIEVSSVNKPLVLASESTAETPTYKEGNCNGSFSAAVTNPMNGVTSSISEYLIEMLPGWHFEDFLDSCSPSFGFCENDHDGMLPYMDGDDMMKSSAAPENLGIWVPQAPKPISSSATNQLSPAAPPNGFKETTITKQPAAMKHCSRPSKRWSDDSFTVPQISLPSSGLKRSRHFR